MSPIAELFDGTELEFPDGTAPEIIQQTAKRVTAQRQQQPSAEPGADMNISAAAPKKKGLLQYIGDEAKAGLKEMSNPATAQYPGAETIGSYSPTARNVIGSVLGASRAAYSVPTGIAQKYVTEPLKEAAAPYTPERLAQMKQFEPGLYQAISQMSPEEQKAGKERQAETAGTLASIGLTGAGTGLVQNAPNVALRTMGRFLDPMASVGGINRPGALRDALESRTQGIADATGNLATAKSELQNLLDQSAAKKTQQADILSNIGQQQQTLKATRPTMPSAPDVSGVNLADTVTAAAPGKVEAGQEFGKVLKGETKRLYAQSSKNYENIAKQFGDELVPQSALQPIVDEAMGLEGELRGVPSTKRVGLQIPPEQQAITPSAPQTARIAPPPKVNVFYDDAVKAYTATTFDEKFGNMHGTGATPELAQADLSKNLGAAAEHGTWRSMEHPASAPAEAAMVKEAAPIRDPFVEFKPRSPEEIAAAQPPQPAKRTYEPIVMGKSGYRGDPQAERALQAGKAERKAGLTTPTGYPEGGSSSPTPQEADWTNAYNAASGYKVPPRGPAAPAQPTTKVVAQFDATDRLTKWMEAGDKTLRNLPAESIQQLTEMEKAGTLTTDAYRQVIANALGAGEKPVDVNKLIRLDQILSEAGRSYGNSGNLAARSAVRQMQSKVQDALSQTGAADALKNAKAFHAQISELVGPDSLAQKVFNLKPDQVVANVFLPAESGTRPNISMIRDAKKIYTANNPEAWQELTGSALKQLQTISADINSGTLDAQKFHRNWARYGETFKEALEPDQYNALKGIDSTIARYNIDAKTAMKAMRENRTAATGLKETAQETKAQFGPDLSQLKEQIRGQQGTVRDAQQQLEALSKSAKSGMRSGISNPYMWMAVAQVGQALQATFTANWAGAGRQLAQGVVWYTLGNPMYLEKVMSKPGLSRALAVISGASKGTEVAMRDGRYVRMLLDDIQEDMKQNQGQ